MHPSHNLFLYKASSIFGVLLDFSRLVERAKEQHLRKERAKKRREMAKNKQRHECGR